MNYPIQLRDKNTGERFEARIELGQLYLVSLSSGRKIEVEKGWKIGEAKSKFEFI